MLILVIAACAIAAPAAAAAAALIGTRRLQLFSRPLGCMAAGLHLTISLTHLLPEAMEDADKLGLKLHAMGLILWGTMFALIILEMCLSPHHSAHATAMSQGGFGLLAGTALHTFCDGIVIASAFSVSPRLGFAAAFAICCHEIPQQLGDYVILLDCGMQRLNAFCVNLIAFIMCVTGGVLGHFILESVHDLVPIALAISAASFMYVALSDLLPRLRASDRPLTLVRNISFLTLGSLLALAISHH